MALVVPGTVHHAVTAQDILNTTDGILNLEMHGCDEITLYIGFPVIVTFDGETIETNSGTTKVGAGGESAYSRYPVGVYRVRRGQTTMVRVRMPPGEGSIEATALKRPQLVVVDGTRSPMQAEPIGANLFSLPFKSARLIPPGPTPWAIGANSINAILTEPTQFEIAEALGSAKSPSEIWIVSLSAVRLIVATGLPSAQALFSIAFYTANTPVGNSEGLFRVFASSPAGPFLQAPLAAPARINLKAVHDGYPTGVGNLQLSATGDVGVTDDTLNVYVNFYYRP